MNYSEIKYVCFDLDGTLLSENKTISEEVQDKLNGLHNVYFNYILISSRHCEEIIPYAEQLGLNQGDFIVSCDGTYIYNYQGELIYESKSLSNADSEYVYDSNLSNPMMIIGKKNDYYLQKNVMHRIYMMFRTRKYTRMKVIAPKKMTEINDHIEKIVVNGNVDKLTLNEYKMKYVVHKTHSGKIEILPQDVSKYFALQRISKLVGVSLKSFLFFGDDYNDMECFENLVHTVAMGNAPSDIKNKAFFITKSNENNGILYALELIFEMQK